MGNLQKLKSKLRADAHWKRSIVRSTKSEILIDLDGDKEADLCLMTTSEEGKIDVYAIDLTGEGEFNLYFLDTNHDDIPDRIFMDQEGVGQMEPLGSGRDEETVLVDAMAAVAKEVKDGSFQAAELGAALDHLFEVMESAKNAFLDI